MTTPISELDFAGIMPYWGGGGLGDHSHREHRRHPAEGLLVQGNTGKIGRAHV